jgi:predicted O-methyltransferase YrrM
MIKPQFHPYVATREDLAGFMFVRTGVELGVAAGHYSAEIAEHVTMLWSIDRWSDHHGTAEYLRAVKRLDRSNVRVVRATFEEALALFPDGSLDFVYIDGYAHTGQEGGKTLEQWWPKLRSGGTFAGHDYHPRWQLTVDAVDAFMQARELDFWITQEVPDEELRTGFPSWWCIKP